MLESYHNAIIPFEKPLGWSSFDLVKKVRGILGIKKVGHAGTLDPLATGLLIIGTGKATKKLAHYQGLEKIYHGQIGLGKTTPSYDLGTPFEGEEKATHHIKKAAIEESAKKLTGTLWQQPPIYSALKVQGKRAYALARAGKAVVLKERKVEVMAFEIEKIALPFIDFRIVCSKGTYIRSLAKDFGDLLGVGGYLARLVRSGIGAIALKNALRWEDLAKQKECQGAEKKEKNQQFAFQRDSIEKNP